MEVIRLDLGLEKTHVLVTGAAGLIGRRVVAAFLEAGCKVSALDISAKGLDHLRTDASTASSRLPQTSALYCYAADIASEGEMTEALSLIRHHMGCIDCCVALASLDLSVLKHHESIVDMPFQQWKQTMDVNVNGTFLTAQLWLQQLKVQSVDIPQGPKRNQNLILVGSESGHFGERSNADYATSKSAVQVGLLQSLKADVPRLVPGARVNAVAPGPVDTARFHEECRQRPEQFWLDAQATTALKKPVPIDAVARAILFLASDNWSSHIHGQILNVDSGKQGKVMWTKEDADKSY